MSAPGTPSADTLEQLIQAYGEALEKHDVEGYVSLFAENAVIEHPVGTPPFLGKDGAKEMISKSFEGSSSHRFYVLKSFKVSPTIILINFAVGLVGKEGKRAFIEGNNVFEINEQGKIVSLKSYFRPDDAKKELKVVLITGGARGIGKATAQLFSKNGYQVVISDVKEELGEETSKEVQGVFFKADVSVPQQVKLLFDLIVAKFGRLDVLVNNAGKLGPVQEITDYPLEDYKALTSTNIDGIFYCLKFALEVMRKQRSGVIVNTSSVTAVSVTPKGAVYGATKAAIHNLTKTAAVENIDYGIRVNAVLPSSTATPMLFEAFAGFQEANSAPPNLAILTPESVANAIYFLTTDQAKDINGHGLPVDNASLVKLP